jgi:sugar O-acyltransferase (sialic acid O-acetyltransferase NeuD family)
MSLRVMVIGAGSQGLVVVGILLARASAGVDNERVEIAGLVDDTPEREGSRVLGVPVLGPVARLRDLAHDAIVVAVGDNRRREALSLALEAQGERLMTCVHPHASVSPDVEVGAGCMISAGVVVTPGAHIGRGVLLNTSCSVDHQTIVEDYAHVSVGATVGAKVTIGTRALIGLGASVMTGRRVGADTVVGAGALVARDLPDGVIAIGVPARVTRANL